MTIRKVLIAIGVLLSLCFALAQSFDFVRLPSDTEDPNGNTVLANCTGEYLDATASMIVEQGLDMTDVTVVVENAEPNRLFTVWMWLKGADAQGNSFGGNPLSGKSGAPLAPTTAFAELRDATGSGNGVSEGANVFTTDANGNALFSTRLNFPLFGGAYPFHKIVGFDPEDERFPEGARLIPVAIVTSGQGYDAPFMMRLVSHCTDNLSHGWSGGAREPWFDFPE